MSRLRKNTWQPNFLGPCPSWQRQVKCVRVDVDLQSLSFLQLDWLFAVFASNGGVRFLVHCSGSKYGLWLKSVDRRSKHAAEKYEKRVRSNFKKYKMKFREGYSLPEPPTPELRVIYDSAAKSQNRGYSPGGATLRSNFDGGEYHWRCWPLNNVEVKGGAK